MVVEDPEAIARQSPFPILGSDSGNVDASINETPVRYCAQRGIEFIRFRAYRNNDQAWVEQKSVSVFRRFTGHYPLLGPDRRADHDPPLPGRCVCT